jgi:predicted dehydrogenase
MDADSSLGIAIVGCGYIADAYAQDIASYPRLNLVGATDIDSTRASAFAGRFGCIAYASLDGLLADARIAIVVNLTAHHAHYAVTARCLRVGMHVHSEKPLAMTYPEALALVDLAHQQKVRLSCAPFTFMGEAQQTAGRLLREGRVGTVRLIYAEVNAGRIETWHPAPQSFYDAGPLFDVGAYPLAIILSFLGPARRVSAYGQVLSARRLTLSGEAFAVRAPDFVVALVELRSGALIRLTTSFYPPPSSMQSGIEFHGDCGSLHLGSSRNFNTTVAYAAYGAPYAPVPLLRAAQTDVRWGVAVADLAEAISLDRPHRAGGELAAHIVEILAGAQDSLQQQRPVELHSVFEPPASMEWAA